jgi:hypothetical protein
VEQFKIFSYLLDRWPVYHTVVSCPPQQVQNLCTTVVLQQVLSGVRYSLVSQRLRFDNVLYHPRLLDHVPVMLLHHAGDLKNNIMNCNKILRQGAECVDLFLKFKDIQIKLFWFFNLNSSVSCLELQKKNQQMMLNSSCVIEKVVPTLRALPLIRCEVHYGKCKYYPVFPHTWKDELCKIFSLLMLLIYGLQK